MQYSWIGYAHIRLYQSAKFAGGRYRKRSTRFARNTCRPYLPKDLKLTPASPLQSIIMLCDAQLLTGLSILTSGYILSQSGLDAYHWQILTYLAWFSTITHLSGLSVLRSHLSKHLRGKYVRFFLMCCLLVMLLVAIVPTAFFDWAEAEYYLKLGDNPDRKLEFNDSSAQPSSFALCYFNLTYGNERFNQTWLYTEAGLNYKSLRSLNSWQAMVVSAILLAYGFCTRAIRLFQPLSRVVNKGVRGRASHMMQSFLSWLASRSCPPSRYNTMWNRMIVKPAIAVFLMSRLTADLITSMLGEVSQPLLDISNTHAESTIYYLCSTCLVGCVSEYFLGALMRCARAPPFL